MVECIGHVALKKHSHIYHYHREHELKHIKMKYIWFCEARQQELVEQIDSLVQTKLEAHRGQKWWNRMR